MSTVTMAGRHTYYATPSKKEVDKKKEITSDSIKLQTKEFFKNGGKINRIRTGRSSQPPPKHETGEELRRRQQVKLHPQK